MTGSRTARPSMSAPKLLRSFREAVAYQDASLDARSCSTTTRERFDGAPEDLAGLLR